MLQNSKAHSALFLADLIVVTGIDYLFLMVLSQ